MRLSGEYRGGVGEHPETVCCFTVERSPTPAFPQATRPCWLQEGSLLLWGEAEMGGAPPVPVGRVHQCMLSTLEAGAGS